MLFPLIFFSMIVTSDVIGGIFSDLLNHQSDDRKEASQPGGSWGRRIKDSALLSVVTLLLALLFNGWEGFIEWNTESSLAILIFQAILGSVARALPANAWQEPSVALATIELQSVVRQAVIGAVARHMALAMVVLLFLGSIFLYAIAIGEI